MLQSDAHKQNKKGGGVGWGGETKDKLFEGQNIGLLTYIVEDKRT